MRRFPKYIDKKITRAGASEQQSLALDHIRYTWDAVKKRELLRQMLRYGAFTLSAAVALPALAQGTPSASRESALAIEEITVSARKVEEGMQNTPVAVSAFSGNDLEIRNAVDLTDLSGVAPNLSFESGSSFSGSSSTPTVFLRGIGQSDFVLTADPAVGVYVDGVYVARSVGSLLDLVDLERVEVLRGPQGTLFGRNTIGGAISLISKAPEQEFSGQAKATFGEDNWYEFKATVNVPINDNLGVRFSGLYRTQDGFVDALQYDNFQLGSEDVWGFRGAVRWEPTDNLRIDISGDYSKDTSGPAAWFAAAAFPDFPVVGPPPPFRNTFNAVVSGDSSCVTADGQRSNPACFGSASILPGSKFENNSLFVDRDGNVIEPKNLVKVFGISGAVEWSLPQFTVKSISAYRGFDARFNNDLDFSPHIVFHNLNSDFNQYQFSQELQFNGSLFDDRLDWITGAYYFKESAQELIELLTSVAVANNFPSAPLFLSDDRNADNESVAGFGQATLNIFDDRLHITAGIRYTKDKKDFFTDTAVNPTVTPELRLSGFLETGEWTPMANIAFDFTENMMGYVTYTEGFRTGGFPPRIIGTPTSVGSFDPEFVDVWEVGFKSHLLDERLRVNVAAFRTSYDDIQVQALRTDLPPGLSSIATDNLAGATLKGFELEANILVTSSFRVDFSLGILDDNISEVTGGTLQSGAFPVTEENGLPYTPGITTSLGASYFISLPNQSELFFRTDWTRIGDQFLGIENIPEQFQKAYNKVSASITYKFPDERIELTFGGRNLTNAAYSTASAIGNDIAGAVQRNISRPRQVYGSVTARF